MTYNVWSVAPRGTRKGGWDVLCNNQLVAWFASEREAMGYARRRHEEDPNAL